MSKLASFLPPPTIRTVQPDRNFVNVGPKSDALVSTNIPPYAYRTPTNFSLPRGDANFNDGGAYPEIHIPQYPHGIGRPESRLSNALAIQLDEEGDIRYDVLLRQGTNDRNKIIYYKHQDLMPKPIANENDPELQRPDEETLKKNAEETSAILLGLAEAKLTAALPVRRAEQRQPDQYIRYTPSQQNSKHNAGAEQRIIRMVEAQKDPMEPPKFKISQKIPRAPPSPPAPVMHSPPRKLTAQEQSDWKIPPCISNWKNPKGFTIPLDKRLAADGRGLQTVQINENFPKLAEALYLGEREARKAVEMRSQVERKVAQHEKEKKEEMLRNLAAKAREERAAGLPTAPAATSLNAAAAAAGIPVRGSAAEKEADPTTDDEDLLGEAERNELRGERARERRRERNLARVAPERRNKLLRRDADRDISEKIALNMPINANAGGAGAGDAQFDERLFGKSKGIDSGFNAGEDDTYNVYDKAWRSEKEFGNALYRPTRDKDKDIYSDAKLDEVLKTNRFVPDRGFAGAGSGQQRDGPVQFEKPVRTTTASNADEEDPFGLDKFLAEAKRSGTTNTAGVGASNRRSERDSDVSTKNASSSKDSSKKKESNNRDEGQRRRNRRSASSSDDERGGGGSRYVDEYEKRRKHKR